MLDLGFRKKNLRIDSHFVDPTYINKNSPICFSEVTFVRMFQSRLLSTERQESN